MTLYSIIEKLGNMPGIRKEPGFFDRVGDCKKKEKFDEVRRKIE